MRNKLISSLAGAAFSFALSGLAFAADMAVKMPVKAPPPLPAPVYSWTGFYVGGNVGYGWGNANTDLTTNGNFTNSATCTSFPFPPCTQPVFPFLNNFTSAVSNTTHPNGVIGGGQIGYNYQFSPNGVLGFEADIQGSGERASSQFADPFSVTFCLTLSAPGVCTSQSSAFPSNVLTSYQAKIDWFGTVRGRLGMLVGDQLLIYGTGGLAYGRVSASGSTNVSVTGFSPPFPPATVGFGASNTNVGFSVGGGMEGRFSYWLPPNWTWKLEYLYLDLGSINAATPFVLVSSNPTISSITGTITTHTHFTDNILRVGLNYQFH